MASLLRLLVVVCTVVTATCSVRQLEEERAELAAYIEATRPTLNLRYRLYYHMAAPVGWMNDPNGFSFYNGEYHMFYQFYPYNSSWGPMHWGHYSSSNLVDWDELPTALLPEEELCFSGSAIVVDDSLVLMYTGRVITTTEPFFNETQYLAYSTDGVIFDKYEGNPVLEAAPNGAPDFRDPKVWTHEDEYYIVIGSTADAERGNVLLFKSPDLKSWEYLSVIGESNGTMGYMWECPDFFELDGRYILLMSPQGLEPVGDRYKNLYQTGYIIGSFNYTTYEFVEEVPFQEIDFGHDFYATQTLDDNGKRILVAWFGMWEVPYPEAEDGWAGALTILRELSLVGDRIIQKPVEAMTLLRSSSHSVTSLAFNESMTFERTAEINLQGDLSQSINLFIAGTNGGGWALIQWDPTVEKVIVDRGDNDIRQVEWYPIGSHAWRLFLDASSLELFCGEGEVVFSTRVYPDGNWVVTNLSPQTLDIEAYYLRQSVPFPSSSTSLNPLLSVIIVMLVPLFSFKSSF